ncbi:MAG: hypothetical protein RLZ45_2422 [Verrucomicrobiota bacterium]|jgi:hypothetical protein
MDIVFKCPGCQQELEVESSAAGESIPCPSCSRTLSIPQPDPSNLKVGLASQASAAAREGKHFAVPVSQNPVQPLIRKDPNPPKTAAKEGARHLRIRSIRRLDCREVGQDRFDQTVSAVLAEIGDDHVVSVQPISYTYVEMGSQKILSDYGVIIVYKG